MQEIDESLALENGVSLGELRRHSPTVWSIIVVAWGELLPGGSACTTSLLSVREWLAPSILAVTGPVLPVSPCVIGKASAVDAGCTSALVTCLVVLTPGKGSGPILARLPVDMRDAPVAALMPS